MATKFYNPENNVIGSTPNGHVEGNTGISDVHRIAATKTPAPLNIAIVGAGIGGLAAAIGLRKNGHNVSVSLSLITDVAKLIFSAL